MKLPQECFFIILFASWDSDCMCLNGLICIAYWGPPCLNHLNLLTGIWKHAQWKEILILWFHGYKKKNQQKGCHGHLVHVVWSGETVALASVQRIHWYCFASFFNYISPNILTQSHKYTHGLLKAMPRKTSFANIDNWTFEEILIFWVSKNSPLCCTCGIFASEHEVR